MLLKAVAARNPWSIYVDTPHSLVLSASEQKASDKVSAEKLTEQYVYKVLDVTREKLKGSVHDDQGQTDVPLGGQDTAGGQPSDYQGPPVKAVSAPCGSCIR
jgi:hypothetical protein